MNLFNSLQRFIRSKLVYKFCFSFLLIITVLCSFIFYAINSTVTDTLYQKHEQRGISIASNLALNVVDFLLVDNISQVHLLIKHTKENEHDIEYIYLVDGKGHVPAHTFHGGFPTDLKKLNKGLDNKPHTLQLIESELGILQDISVPILQGSLGHIHVGLSRQFIDQKLSNIRLRILLICLVACIIAVTFAVILSRRITQPIVRLTNISIAMAEGKLNHQVDLQNIDEVGKLAHSFDLMRNSIQKTILSLQKEIAERKRVENKYFKQYAEFQAIFNSITDAIVFTDLNRQIVMTNPAFESIFGYNLKDVQGKTTQFFYANPDEYQQQGKKRFRKEAKEISPVYEIQYRRKDGSIFTSETLGVPVKDQAGEIIGFLGVIRDVSERKKAEKIKEDLEAQLRQTHKLEAVGTLAGGIAHDFNNILAIIFGNAELANVHTSNNNPAKHNVGQILSASKRAKDLVKRLLTFSRQEKGERHPLHLCRLVDESLETLRATIPKTVTLKVNIPSKCRDNIADCLMIDADPTQIHQLFLNLCVNAVQAMDEEGTLEITVNEVTYNDNNIPASCSGLKPGTYVYLSIADTGKGVSPDLVDKIFDPFFTTKEVDMGTGIGLSVVQGIVKNHDGHIYVESEPGNGATFHIYFPFTTNTKSETEIDKDIQIPMGNEHILFIDDEEMLADVGKSMLESLGYNVTALTKSTDALELFQNDPYKFDLIITDQSMPNISGSELAKQLLHINPGISIILCTGYSSKVDKEKAREIGIREFALKPLDIKEIALLIRKVLDGLK